MKYRRFSSFFLISYKSHSDITNTQNDGRRDLSPPNTSRAREHTCACVTLRHYQELRRGCPSDTTHELLFVCFIGPKRSTDRPPSSNQGPRFFELYSRFRHQSFRLPYYSVLTTSGPQSVKCSVGTDWRKTGVLLVSGPSPDVEVQDTRTWA